MYIGQKEIKDSNVVDKHREIEMTEVEYQDGSKERMPTKMFQSIQSEESVDATSLRYKRSQQAVKEILELLLSWGIRIDEIQYVTTILLQSVNSSISAAASKLWGKDSNEIDLVDVDKVLLDKVTLGDILKES